MTSTSATIVVGFVDSRTGWAAFEATIEEAKRRNARMVVVHSAPGGDATPGKDIQKYEDLFEDLAERLRRADISADFKLYIRGLTPADDIRRAAQETGAELIVIGYRERTPTGKAFLGSEAQDILREAPCPVLGVRADY